MYLLTYGIKYHKEKSLFGNVDSGKILVTVMYSLRANFLTFGTYKYLKEGARLIASTDNQGSTIHKNKTFL